jgi:hypothetical protein
MKMKGQITVTLNDDGSVSLDSSKAVGTEAEILAELKELATMLGGSVTVEKHIGGAHHHHHHHGDGRMHSHG